MAKGKKGEEKTFSSENMKHSTELQTFFVATFVGFDPVLHRKINVFSYKH